MPPANLFQIRHLLTDVFEDTLAYRQAVVAVGFDHEKSMMVLPVGSPATVGGWIPPSGTSIIFYWTPTVISEDDLKSTNGFVKNQIAQLIDNGRVEVKDVDTGVAKTGDQIRAL
jgi:hypothetical protein